MTVKMIPITKITNSKIADKAINYLNILSENRLKNIFNKFNIRYSKKECTFTYKDKIVVMMFINQVLEDIDKLSQKDISSLKLSISNLYDNIYEAIKLKESTQASAIPNHAATHIKLTQEEQVSEEELERRKKMGVE